MPPERVNSMQAELNMQRRFKHFCDNYTALLDFFNMGVGVESAIGVIFESDPAFRICYMGLVLPDNRVVFTGGVESVLSTGSQSYVIKYRGTIDGSLISNSIDPSGYLKFADLTPSSLTSTTYVGISNSGIDLNAVYRTIVLNDPAYMEMQEQYLTDSLEVAKNWELTNE